MPQQHLPYFAGENSQQVRLELGITGFATTSSRVLCHGVLEDGHTFFDSLERLYWARVEFLNLTPQHFQADAAAVVHLANQTSPGVDAVKAVRSPKHRLGSTAKASGQEPPYLRVHRQGLFGGQPIRSGFHDLGLGDHFRILGFGPFEQFSENRRLGDEVALDAALPGRAALHAVPLVFGGEHDLIIE